MPQGSSRLVYLVCVLTGIVLLWLLHVLRIRGIRLELTARLSARIDERERIARELHDTLLQSAQGLILFVQSLAGRLEQPDSMRKDVAAALDRADELLSEARDRVNDLCTVGLDLDLEKAIVRFCVELFKDEAMHLTITSAGSPRVIALGVADDAYRICREALTNAYLHAHATAVTVEIDYASAEFVIRLRDDGRGIEAVLRESGAQPGHWGLQGMLERALRHGGTLTVAGTDGLGTEVALTVPAADAYPPEPRFRDWMSRVLRSGAKRTTRIHH